MSQLSPRPSRKPVEAKLASVRRLRRFSYLLDSAIGIPGTRWRLGLDPILDAFPVVGDFLGTALSVYIVIEAARLGSSRETLIQMVTNILVDAVIGFVPVLGTVADAVWKANIKNVALLEQELDVPQSERKADWLFLALLLGVLLLAVVALVIVSALLLSWLWTAIFG
jgi:Domain of unknown function (DUF4112)